MLLECNKTYLESVKANVDVLSATNKINQDELAAFTELGLTENSDGYAEISEADAWKILVMEKFYAKRTSNENFNQEKFTNYKNAFSQIESANGQVHGIIKELAEPFALLMLLPP